MRYWWVNQNQTYRHKVTGGYLWSPIRDHSQDAWTMLQAMLKHCFEQCSSIASGNAQAMPKHSFEHASSNAQACRRVTPVRVVRTTYGEHEDIMRDHRCRLGGWSPTESLIAKSVAGLGPPGREDCRGVRRNDRKTLKSILVSSSRLVPLFETASCFRGLKRANSETRLMSRLRPA
jgi:hypothetical protein